MIYNYMAKPKKHRRWQIVAVLAVSIVVYLFALANYWVGPGLLLP